MFLEAVPVQAFKHLESFIVPLTDLHQELPCAAHTALLLDFNWVPPKYRIAKGNGDYPPII